jgi:hypothetical protein
MQKNTNNMRRSSQIKTIIFGAGSTGRKRLADMRESTDRQVVGFVDNDAMKVGTVVDGVEVFSPASIVELAYDQIVVASFYYDEIVAQLHAMGVPHGEIIVDTLEKGRNEHRVFWLQEYARWAKQRKYRGAVAEAGVFRGDFARRINEYFPDSKCYLFDTFEGFDAKDITNEERKMGVREKGYGATSEELVMKKMPHPEMVVIHKGLFPDSASGVDEQFCFVNLDMDLYQPTLAGLEFFWEKLGDGGGCILVHDYFGAEEAFPGAKKAVDEWISKKKKAGDVDYVAIPIGDGYSIALVKVEV